MHMRMLFAWLMAVPRAFCSLLLTRSWLPTAFVDTAWLQVIALVTALQQHHAQRSSAARTGASSSVSASLSPGSGDVRAAAAAAGARLHPPTHALPVAAAVAQPAHLPQTHVHMSSGSVGASGSTASARSLTTPPSLDRAGAAGPATHSRGTADAERTRFAGASATVSRSRDDDAASASFGDDSQDSFTRGKATAKALGAGSDPRGAGAGHALSAASATAGVVAAAGRPASLGGYGSSYTAGGVSSSYASQAHGHNGGNSAPDSPSSLYDFGDTSGGGSEGGSPAPAKAAPRTGASSASSAAVGSLSGPAAAKPSGASDVRAVVAGIGDLQRVGPAALQAAKARMDVLFESNRLKPGDPGYVYDKRVDFAVPQAISDWDDE